jgi:ABC-2 type transport system ATP-binding protein
MNIAARRKPAPQRKAEARAREMTAALVVNQVTHNYGGAPVLKQVTLVVGPGEIYCLLGRNGAGKSTLLRAVCGRLQLSEGRIRIAGRYTPAEAAARRLVGYVPQDIALHRQLTVGENLNFFARMAGLSSRAASSAIDAMLDRAELVPEARQIAGTLSGGYQRRVNIAAAALTNPFLLVLDEPTVGIDVAAREAIHRLLRSLRQAGTAILFTTHDLDQAQVLSDRVGILQLGRLIVEGEPETLISESFGDVHELIVELRHPPDLRGRELLKRSRMLPMPSPTIWFTEVSSEDFDASSFTAYLAKNGIEVREVRFRKPDLTSLFLKVVGVEAAP